MAVAAAPMTAAQRRLVYGVNVALSLVLAFVLLVLAVWLAGRYRTQFDLTRSGENSLSPRTRAMLRGLDQNLRITGIYGVLSEYQKFAQKRRDMVRDLLGLYEDQARGRITTEMIDPMKEQARITALLTRLKDKPAYRDEARPHAEALEQFPQVNQAIRQLVESEAQRCGELAGADPRLARLRELVILWRHEFPSLAAATQAIAEEVEELTTRGDIPRYGKAVEEVKKHLSEARGRLQIARDWMTNEAPRLPDLPPEAATYFQGAEKRFDPVLHSIADLLKKMEGLGPVKLETVYQSLSNWTTQPPILVETDQEARVVDFNDVWPWRTDQQVTPPDGDPRDFAGEAAVSSAILQLTQKERTGVIWVRFGGQSPIRPDFSRVNLQNLQSLPRAPYQQLNALLEKANFKTDEWNVAESTAPPTVSEAKRVVYVVLPPTQPPQPNPMQPAPLGGMSPEQRQAVLDAIDRENCAGAIFLAGWSAPASRFALSGAAYEYADYLKQSWGIEVMYRFLALHFAPHPQLEGLWVPANRQDPTVITTDVIRFTAHPIAQPLQSLPGAFTAVCPLKLIDPPPSGVSAAVVAQVPPTQDVWAFEDISRVEQDFQKKYGTAPHDDDVRAPFPVAVAAAREGGRRIVVFASERFASDDVAQALAFQLSGQGLQAFQAHPANAELFINSLHWITGDSERIAVGPRRSDVPRLDRLREDQARWWRVFLVAVWPGIILAGGAGVWFLRRR